MPNPRSSRRRRLARTQPDRSLVRTALASATAAALLLCAVPAPDAHANSYDIYACYAGQGTYLNPGNSAASWTMADNNGTAYYLPYDQCGSDGPNGFGVISRSGYTAPTGDYGEVLFQAPPGLHIRQVQLWRSLIDYGIGAGGTSQRNYAWNLADGQLPGVGDEYDGSADVPYGAVGSGDTTDNGIVTSNYTSVNLASALPGQYAYVVGCAFYNGCPTGGQNPLVPSGFDTVLDIYGAIVSIEDDIPPTLSLADSGLLDGQPQSGTVPLTITASATAGIASLAVFTAGSQTPAFSEDFTQTSSCQFWEAVPCQNLDSYQYPVDTTKLPNGTYYITVKASDPAGNVTSALAVPGDDRQSPASRHRGAEMPDRAPFGVARRWPRLAENPLRPRCEARRRPVVRGGASCQRCGEDRRGWHIRQRDDQRCWRLHISDPVRAQPETLDHGRCRSWDRARSGSERHDRRQALHDACDQPAPDQQRRHDPVARRGQRRPVPAPGASVTRRSQRGRALAGV